MRRSCLLGVLAAAAVLAGCGGSSRHAATGTTTGTVTVPAYGVFPQTTVRGSGSARSRDCTTDARAFARGALMFLAHSGPEAAYPADLYYVILREDFADFEARRCDSTLLGAELDRRLTAEQRRSLVDGLPRAMAGAVRAALARAGS